MDILDDMGVRKLSAKVFLKVNYSFKTREMIARERERLFHVLLWVIVSLVP